jgi:hypothetical protein
MPVSIMLLWPVGLIARFVADRRFDQGLGSDSASAITREVGTEATARIPLKVQNPCNGQWRQDLSPGPGNVPGQGADPLIVDPDN